MTRETYRVDHYTQVQGDDLATFKERWPNFSPRELACKGTGKLVIDADSLDRLQALRNKLGVPLNVTSAYRSPEHNRAVGGAKRSMHMQARAFDISMVNHDPEQFEAAAEDLGFRGIGHYPAPRNFMHIDTRENPARWNKGGWFTTGATRLPVERTDPIINRPEAVGGGAVGVVTILQALKEIGIDLTGVDWTQVLIAVAVLAVAYVAIRAYRRRGGDI